VIPPVLLILQCKEFAWHTPTFAGWAKQCYMTVGPEAGERPLVKMQGVVSGKNELAQAPPIDMFPM